MAPSGEGVSMACALPRMLSGCQRENAAFADVLVEGKEPRLHERFRILPELLKALHDRAFVVLVSCVLFKKRFHFLQQVRGQRSAGFQVAAEHSRYVRFADVERVAARNGQELLHVIPDLLELLPVRFIELAEKGTALDISKRKLVDR